MKTIYVHFYGSLFDLINNVRPLQTPEDFKGLKIRSYGALAAGALRTLGANPVVMSPSEMYLALQRGTIDGLISGVTSLHQRKLWEVGKYATVTGAAFGAFPVNITKSKFDGLPGDVKKALLAAGRTVQTWSVGESMRQDRISLAFIIKKKRVQTYLLTPDAKAGWSKAMAPVYDKWGKGATDNDRKLLEWVRSLAGSR